MLPFTARNRKMILTEETSKSTAGEMISKLKKSTFHLRSIPVKTKCFLVFFCFLSVYMFISLYLSWGVNRLSKEGFLEVYKCPACYGRSFCYDLFDNQFDLSGFSKYELFDIINVRNVHFASHKSGEQQIVLKKLAYQDEIKAVDDFFCRDSFREPGCDLGRTFVVTQTAKEIAKNGLQPHHFKDSSFMFLCVTHKLIKKITEKYQEKTRDYGPLTLDDNLQLLYTAKVNSEPLILQTFPESEGWPFPRYHGACGRYIIQSYGGKSLKEFYNAPWEKRVDLAYQMLKMTERLTADSDWSLYWTDLAYSNFAVDPAGKLTYIDVENVVVVDKQATKLANKEKWNDFAESEFAECSGNSNDCLTFDVNQMCTHYETDHNYYAVCRNMLSKYADNRQNGGYGELLHDMPANARDNWDLENLLNECVRPSQPQGRIKAAHKLLQALDHLRNEKYL